MDQEKLFMNKGELGMITLAEASKPIKTNFVQKYPLATFFLLVFGLTWSFMIVDALGSHEVFSFRLPIPLLIVMGYMPTLAAVIVTGLTKGKAGIRALFGKLLIARVSIRWYAFAIFGFGAMSVIAILVSNLLAGSTPSPILSEEISHFPGPLAAVLNVVMLYLVLGLINGEELAWRGFALPRLQAKYNALTSSLILGAVWGLFHLPLFFTLTGSSQADMSFFPFVFSTMILSVLFTWVFNNTRGSILLAYLFHAGTNTWTRVFAIDHSMNPYVSQALTGITVLIASIIIVTAGPENLSRKTARIQEE
jgi:membrane protease YdiL (CAAX protease family)